MGKEQPSLQGYPSGKEFTSENISPTQNGEDYPYYDSYIQNFWVDVQSGMCHVETLSIDGGPQGYRFPITKRYDREALTDLLLAASMQFNSDYVSEDYIYDLVTNAIASIWVGMRSHGIRKLRPREVVAA